MADQERIEILVSLRDALSKTAKLVKKEIDQIGDSSTKAGAKLDNFDRKLKKTGRTAGKTAAKTKVAGKAIDDVGDEAVGAAVKVGIFNRVLSRASGGGGGMSRFIRVGKAFRRLALTSLLFLITDLVGFLATALVGLGAAATAAIAGLSPLAGLLVAYPGYLAAFVQGMGLAKFATHGLHDAIMTLLTPGASAEDIANTLGRLGPEGQKFARSVASLRPQMMKLKSDIQEGVLPGFTKLVELFKGTYFDIFRKGMLGGIDVINQFTAGLEEYLKTTGAQESIGRIMDNNNKILGNFGRAGLAIVKALVNVLDAAGPMLIAMSDSIAKFFENTAKYTEQNKGALTNFFNTALNVAKNVYRYFKLVFGGLFQIGKASMGLATDMGNSLMAGAEKFNAWTKSAEGQKKLKKFFTDIKPVVYEIGYLFKDLAKAILDIGLDPSFQNTVKTIRTELLPALVTFIKSVNSSGFLASFSKLLAGLAKFGQETGVFGILADTFKVIGFVLEQIGNAFAGMPTPVKKVVGFLLTLLLLGGKLKLFAGIFRFMAGSIKTVGAFAARVGGWFMKLASYGGRFAPLLKFFGKIGLKFVPIIGWLTTIWMVLGWINNRFGIFTKAWDKIKGGFSWVKDKLGFGDDKKTEQRFAGGPVLAGRRYMVGELGPEAFLRNNGTLSIVGKSGPEILDFKSSGTIIPNHLLGAITSAGDKNHKAMMALASGTKSIPTNKTKQDSGALSVSIGNITVNQAQEFDVVRAVRKGIMEAERDRRERR